MDDPFVSCPYNAVHRVPRSRLAGHIVKCQKNSPVLAICPYNATHRLPEEEMKKHVVDCPAKIVVAPEHRPPQTTGSLNIPKPILQKHYLPETDPDYEEWD